ncbi:MAG TPA: hypothetical protein VG758_13865, partial [Hyphomicrobiaceae bacterium]|nr:hypothetical protein [Hyphomicrobiaceae bacterium]
MKTNASGSGAVDAGCLADRPARLARNREVSRRDTKDDAAIARATATSPDGPALEGRMRVVGIILFALIMSLNGFV